MRPIARLLALLVVSLALLTWLAYGILTSTTRRWFENDLRTRATLAVQSAHQGLVSHWKDPSPELLQKALTNITRDERIMAASACALSGETIASTTEYPSIFSCASLWPQMQSSASQAAAPWTLLVELPGGPVHLSAVPLSEPGEAPRGYVVLEQDLRFLERREATMRNQLLVAFAVLSLGASLVTLIALKLARQGWLSGLRKALRGQPSQEFQPVVRDMRELVQQLARNQRELDGHTGQWTAARLRSVLTEHLHGERIVVVANREPYIHQRLADGSLTVQHPASGLVTALEPVMRACSGVWVAHGSGSADRQVVDEKDRIRVPPLEKAYVLRRVWMTEAEEAGYYYGFSNEGLWPLCHLAHTRPVFRSEDWAQYRAVNQKFADAVCQEVDTEDPIILVQDYHFALAPQMIRKRLPRATILTFWHIPWPNAERFGICPWRSELLQGLLGSSIMGFHTQQHCNHFLDAVDSYLEARIDRELNAVVQQGRPTLIRPYPISIEWPVHWLDDLPSVQTCRKEVFAELGLPEDARLGVGVDRLDYTKGIEERLSAVDQLLQRYPQYRGRFTFVQLAAPSRTRIGHYQELNQRVEKLVESINSRWQTASYRPILLHRAHHEPAQVFRYYRAADLCYVSSLHDGMNLVAKEFVAARDDEQGVLILSQFTGAARELTEALVVNPYDFEQASDAFAAALRMPPTEQKERLRAMRSLVAELNVYRWAGRMLIDASQVRRRDRLTGKLSSVSLLAGRPQ